MDHADSPDAARVRRFLAEEPVLWLSTVRPDGTPHIVPIWFWWDGEAILVFSKPDARKVRNLRANPAAMLAVGDADDDFDVALLEGRATLLTSTTAEMMPAAHVHKYADRMAAIGLSPAEYAATYSQVIRIVPTRYLGWHGRTVPASLRTAALGVRPSLRERLIVVGVAMANLPRPGTGHRSWLPRGVAALVAPSRALGPT